MKKMKLSTILTIAIFFPAFVYADTMDEVDQIKRNYKSCIALAEKAACIRAAYDSSDALLNRQYQAILAKLNPTEQDSLRIPQREWAKSKDLNCMFSMHETLPIKNECSVKETLAKISELYTTYENPPSSYEESITGSHGSGLIDVAPETAP